MDATRPAARRLTAVLPCPRRVSTTAAQPFGVYLVSTDSVFSRDAGESRDVVDVSRWSFAIPLTFGQYH